MPRSKKTSPGLDTPEKNVKQGRWWCANDAPWLGFVNVSLSDSDKAEFLSWRVEHQGDVAAMMEDLVSEGMKYGIAYDRENECYICTLTGNLIEGSTTRACMTTRAGNWAEVDALAVWKHYVLLGENYGDLLASGRKRNWG